MYFNQEAHSRQIDTSYHEYSSNAGSRAYTPLGAGPNLTEHVHSKDQSKRNKDMSNRDMSSKDESITPIQRRSRQTKDESPGKKNKSFKQGSGKHKSSTKDMPYATPSMHGHPSMSNQASQPRESNGKGIRYEN